MMTHGNVLATLSAVMTIVPDIGTKDVYLAYLPMAHILELAAEVCGYTFLEYIPFHKCFFTRAFYFHFHFLYIPLFHVLTNSSTC